MASVTLSESAKLSQDMLAVGVIENVITINRFFAVLPFEAIEGNSIAYNRENVLGDVDVEGVGDSIGAKAAATFTQLNGNLTTIIGDAEVNGLIQATRSNKQDQTAIQIASKAKSTGRKFNDMLINGSGVSNQFAGLISLVASGQKAATGNNGGALSFAFLDEMIGLVIDKDGQVDYFQMPIRTFNSYLGLLRALGGANITETKELPDGRSIEAYRGVPLFRNDYIPINQSKGAGSNQTTVFAGTLDDGSHSYGIAGITAANAAGIQVEEVGLAEGKDERIWRIKWYVGLVNFSEKGLSCAEGITN